MIFNCESQIREDKLKYVELVKQIIPLWNKYEEVNLHMDELSQEKTQIEKEISEMESVREKVPTAAKDIDAKISEYNDKLADVEFNINEANKESITLKEEISQFKKYILSIRDFYRNTYLGTIYKESDGDLYLTEWIICGYEIPTEWSMLAMPKGVTLKCKSLERLMDELLK